MKKISNAVVQIKEKQNEILTSRLLDVNIRLFNENVDYKKIVLHICKHMKKVLWTKFSDYRKLSGISGANVGIPFNIVLFIKNDRTYFMLNPHITRMSDKTTTVKSNCGSLNLKIDQPVKRREWIEVSYYTVSGKHTTEVVNLRECGGTIQHEIDHNRGVLITDTYNHL
jgi:peptide deformylase